MKKIFLTFLCIVITVQCFADFVDVAEIHVNNELVRRVARNESPYLISLNKFKLGDTLTFSIWTDHGGERNSYFSYVNLISGLRDTLQETNELILTESLINEPHLFSVTLIYERESKTIKSKWEVFKIIKNPKIENIYNTSNKFVSTILELNRSKNQENELNIIISDTVFFNYSPKIINDTLIRILLIKSIFVSSGNSIDYLSFNSLELDYFNEFNSKDCMQLFNLNSDLSGELKINEHNLNSFELSIMTYSRERLIFKFISKGNIYILSEVNYKK